MEILVVVGFVAAVIFVALNTYAKDWGNPYYWIILGVFVLMALGAR